MKRDSGPHALNPMRWRVKFLIPSSQATGVATLEGDDAVALNRELARDGRVLLSARRVFGIGDVLPRVPRRFPVALFCEELKALLDAGLNLVQALDALRVNEQATGAGVVYARLLERVQQGKRFSLALEEDPVFPRVLVSAVRGSEHTSGIGGALGRYLDYHRRLDELRSRVISASIYPALVLGLGLVIVLFLLGYVVPRFATIYAEHATNLGLGTRAVLSLGQSVSQNAWIISIALALALYLLAHRLVRAAGGVPALDVLQRVRWLRAPVLDLERARIFETLSILLRGGFTLPYALDVARDVCLARRSATALDRVRGHVEAGGALHDALRKFDVGDEVATRLSAAGEESGDLAGAMQHVADHYGRRFSRTVERLTRVAEPVMLIVIGAVIGGIVLMMYMPIFDLATTVGR